MWVLATVAKGTEFAVAQELRAETLLLYTREKVRVDVTPRPTRANPRPRAVFKAVTRDVVRWPGYIFVETDNAAEVAETRGVRGLVTFGGDVAQVSTKVIASLRSLCDATGRIIRRSSLYAVGDVLRFVAPNPLAGLSGEVLRLGDASVELNVGRFHVTAPYAEVVPIGSAA